jgi:hypothetical protein
VLESGHGGEVARLLGRPRPFVRGAELLVMDDDSGAEEGRVVGALAGVLVRRRRPPPPLAQLLQPRLQTRGEANLLLITTCKQVLRISFIKNAFFIFLLRVACLGRGLVVQLCCAIAFETDSNDSPLHPATSNLKMSDRSYLGKKKTLSRYHQQIKQQLEHKSSLNKFALLLHA